jgi:hypothetical protein
VARAARKPPAHIPPIRDGAGNWARSEQEKANTFAQHLRNTFTPNNIQSDLDPLPRPEQGTLLKYFSPMEVKSTIMKLNSKKAPGLDLITTVMLKEISKKATVRLVQIFNAIIRLRHFPQEWKTAKVIMLAKPGKPAEEPGSYRPITLLPTISKLFEKLLNKRVLTMVEKINIIPEHQFGF